MLLHHTSSESRLRKQASHPVWPMPSLNGREPAVIETSTKMPGIDLAYARAYPDELLATYPIGPNGSPTHFMPSSMPAFAVADGTIMYAGKQDHGHAIAVNHNNGWATFYSGLEHMFARATSKRPRGPKERVRAGDVLGYVGSQTRGAMKCLHFELWKLDPDHHFEPVGDTLDHMRSWLVLPWQDERLTPGAATLDRIAA